VPLFTKQYNLVPTSPLGT